MRLHRRALALLGWLLRLIASPVPGVAYAAPLPRDVKDAFERYLACGDDFSQGFVRLLTPWRRSQRHDLKAEERCRLVQAQRDAIGYGPIVYPQPSGCEHRATSKINPV